MCARAVEWLDRAVTLADKDASAPVALWHQADCHVKENRPSKPALFLKAALARYPQSPEAKEAKARLDASLGGESWAPTADDHAIPRAGVSWALNAGGGRRGVASISGDGSPLIPAGSMLG